MSAFSVWRLSEQARLLLRIVVKLDGEVREADLSLIMDKG